MHRQRSRELPLLPRTGSSASGTAGIVAMSRISRQPGTGTDGRPITERTLILARRRKDPLCVAERGAGHAPGKLQVNRTRSPSGPSWPEETGIPSTLASPGSSWKPIRW